MTRGLPRTVEAALALGAITILSPLLAVTALLVLAGSGTPVIFRQTRVGLRGRPFTMFKFRTMRVSAGPSVTAGDDPRITTIGRFLRRTKFDELPELWNVLVGDMSFVGPRPEAAKYVNENEPRWRQVLEARPGLTDPTTLALIDEETLLAAIDGDRERYYVEELLPKKLDGYLAYLARRTWGTDVRVIATTAASIIRRAGRKA